MKNHLTRAMVFIVAGIVLFTISYFKNIIPDNWAGFTFGFSIPLMVFGVVALVQYLRAKSNTSTDV